MKLAWEEDEDAVNLTRKDQRWKSCNASLKLKEGFVFGMNDDHFVLLLLLSSKLNQMNMKKGT